MLSEILLLQEQERSYTIALVPPNSDNSSLVFIIDNLQYPLLYIEDRNEYVMTVNTNPLTELLIRVYPRPLTCMFDKTYDANINTKRYITITRRKGVVNYRSTVKEICNQFINKKWTLYHLTD